METGNVSLGDLLAFKPKEGGNSVDIQEETAEDGIVTTKVATSPMAAKLAQLKQR